MQKIDSGMERSWVSTVKKHLCQKRLDACNYQLLRVVFGYLDLDLDLDFKSIDLKCLDFKSIDFKISCLDPFI